MAERQALNEHGARRIMLKIKQNPNLKLTLTETCLRKVSVYLLSSNDILGKIEKFTLGNNHSQIGFQWCESVEAEAKNNLSKLVVPETVKKEIMSLLRPMSYEILRWKHFLGEILFSSRERFDKRVLQQLQWTCEGAIDHRKTAQALLRLDVLDVEKRYRLACLYCLEDDIRPLWEQLPETTRRHFRGGLDESRLKKLEFYWPYVLLGEESKLPDTGIDSYNKFAFMQSARDGNKTACEYFFRKLGAERRDFVLYKALYFTIEGFGIESVKWSKARERVKLGDVVAYLLSLQSPETQIRLLRGSPFHFLSPFLDWPWHGVFLDILEAVWPILPEKEYDSLVRVLMNEVFYIPSLFREVFIGSPAAFKNYFVAIDSDPLHGGNFHVFVSFRDIETIRVIFENISRGDVIKLLSTDGFLHFLDRSWMTDTLGAIELCFQVASLSETEAKTLRAVYTRFLDSPGDSQCTFGIEKRWEPIFAFLDDAVSGNKRTSGDETAVEVKKLCTG